VHEAAIFQKLIPRRTGPGPPYFRIQENAHQKMAASALTVRFLFTAELAGRICVAGHAGLIRL
jgi:hypothetical protein